jgi:hypothetical protein
VDRGRIFVVPPGVPTLKSTKVGSNQRKKRLCKFSFVMVQARHPYNKQILRCKLFILGTYHLDIL